MSSKVDVQKITLQVKVKQVNNKLSSSKIDLQQKDLKIEPIKYTIKV